MTDLAVVPDPATDPEKVRIMEWCLSIWHSTALPTPVHEIDRTDKANPTWTGRYGVAPGGRLEATVPCSLDEHREAMDAINDALTGNHRQKAKYLK